MWNANGLTCLRQAVESIITTNQIVHLLISEAHFTDLRYFKIAGYTIYNTKHPNDYDCGSAAKIRQNVMHYELEKFD